MKYQEQHEAFKRLIIAQGIGNPAQLHEALPFGNSIPPRLVDKWLNRMLVLPDGFSTQRRYVNRFKLGADPEFIFVDHHERINAKDLGLQQGLAYGMDNNGRLTEIRPYPSRSAVNVVASILATLRWMSVLVPTTLRYEWTAGAFLLGDGLGGHVHLGRKRPGRELEVKALDTLEEQLLALGVYPAAEVARRRQGDERNQHYGMPGDIRKQTHGYEYRTFPSWLDSPELAFLTITLSKLVVQNPKLAQGYMPLPGVDRYFQRIRNLLAYFKDVDDDARLALKMISRKLPVHIGGDFKRRWGFDGLQLAALQNIQFVPSSIKPGLDDVQEMFAHLEGTKPLVSRIPIPTWTPLAPPNGYQMAISGTNTVGAKGLGELLWDVCTHRNCAYQIVNSRELRGGVFFAIPAKLANVLPTGWQKFCNGKIVSHGQGAYIMSAEKKRDPLTFQECRRLLLETILPFWKISEVKPDSYQQWAINRGSSQRKHFAGKLLYGDAGVLKEGR